MARKFNFIDLDKFLETVKGEQVIVEPKYDGFYLNLVVKDGKAKGITRQGACRFVRDCDLPDGSYFGEWIFGTEWSNNFMGSKKYDTAFLFDYDDNSIPYGQRLLRLSKWIENSETNWVNMGEFFKVHRTDIESWKKQLETGEHEYEGVVIRNPESNDFICVRLKKQITVDYVIMGYEDSDAVKYKKHGWIKAIKCGLYINGKLKEITRVGSMDEVMRNAFSRKKSVYKGKVVEIKGYQLFKSGALRHPSFMRMRGDKSPEECTFPEDGGNYYSSL